MPLPLTLAGRRIALLDRARIYACGITPYDVTHLGHAATFVWVDTLGRVLRTLGVEPIVCRNVTDVDDVLVEAARRSGSRYDDLAAFQEFQFEGDMAALNVRAPDYQPRAHRYVEPVIRLAQALLDADAAYERGGSVYFRGEGVARSVGLDTETALRLAAEYGGRPDDPAKEHPLDVAVWQASEEGYPAWDSPWAPGRPGWHAECVAMALSVFGIGVDFHAGGADLRYPHHAYHAAMAEKFTGTAPYARAWFQIGKVTVDGAKMAKSAGNLVMLEPLLAAHPAAVIRLMILDRPWARDWDYTPDLLAPAAERLDKLHTAAGRGIHTPDEDLAQIRRLLAEDLDVPAALDAGIALGGGAARLLVTTLGLA
ncbi:cysteine--tRNA ligase [Amycolatopsis cynarae]|uniref:Cysteine--tRNA ligase n=1 Tax=Amycolatopsis cynarae TaxID=2995223 RepID=A0ABY7AYL1_9PSEU|nr:cysteine--tRNA ligase [Amycolatopsis sp. HUAS 11-8]WAL64299.1 cysteine--tRNA ligase [Amycolatopsis sp. HUAS 11-8]